ncbi:MAG: hypothetical protein WCE23_08900 [Candidatus Binatus sp.]|uniref:hypothetical protein n=1 Tax=Candidatus Binatus sp. TaxID=2811406 RepID=UPI003C783CD7
MKASSLKTAQIGASGVLLIQYRLLKCGIESAPMTTDAGIDLVAYLPKMERAVTIQVKTCLRPKAAGGKGRASLDWWLPKASPAELVGLVNLGGDQAWLLRHSEFVAKAQQQPMGRLHLYFYTDPNYSARKGCHERDFEPFRIKSRMGDIFGLPEIST